MVKVTCLFPMKSYYYCSSTFAHLEFLIFNLRTAILLLGTIIGQTYKANRKIHLRTIHQNKRKTSKERMKGQGSATITRTQETRKTQLRLKRNGYRKFLCYPRDNRTISFIYFSYKRHVKVIQKKIFKIIISSYCIYIYEIEVKLSQIIYIIVYVEITQLNN